MALKHYLAEVLDPSLVLSLASALLGVVAASRYAVVPVPVALLIIVGAVCAQVSVNLVDDYTDFKSGIDKETVKTKFNGGSEAMVHGDMKPGRVLLIGLLSLVLSAAIGAYLLYSHPQAIPLVLPLIAIGGLTVLLYSGYLIRVPFLAEPLVMLNFALISVGAFFLLSGASHIGGALFAFVPSGMMVGIVLLINEVPDRKPDSKYGRKSGVVILRAEKRIVAYYLLMQAAAYALVLLGIAAGAVPVYAAAVLATLPFVVFIARGTLRYSGARDYECRMAANVMSAFLFIVLLIVGYLA